MRIKLGKNNYITLSGWQKEISRTYPLPKPIPANYVAYGNPYYIRYSHYSWAPDIQIFRQNQKADCLNSYDDLFWNIVIAGSLYELNKYIPNNQKGIYTSYSPYVKDAKKYADELVLKAVKRYNLLSAFQ